MKTETIEIKKIIADKGCVFSYSDKSIVFGNEIYLGCNDSENNYIEISIEEAEDIIKLQEVKIEDE